MAGWSNGAATPTATLALTGVLIDGDTYVICQPSIAASFNNLCDIKNSVIGFNGNDAVALSQGTTVIDQVGVIGPPAPATGWAVCGVTDATVNTILLRKPSVSSPTNVWATSAGTNTTDCQWLTRPAATEADMLANNTMGVHMLTP